MHDATEINISSFFRKLLFTPGTIVLIFPLQGAVTITFLAPACVCFTANSFEVNKPVDSMTISTFNFFQGSFSGSLILNTLILLFPIFKSSFPASIFLS